MIDANTLLVTAQRKLSEAEFSLTLSILGIMKVKGDIADIVLQG
jgi:hypothetical protein